MRSDGPIVKMTAKAKAQAAEQKAKREAKENMGILGAPIIRSLRSRAI